MLKVFLLLAITLASAAALASASASGSLCQGALTSQLDNYAAAQKALNMANQQESMVQNLILGDPASPCKICKIVKEGRASDTQSLQKYGQDQVWLAAPGVAFCGLTVILLIFFLLARCCCATCCCTSETMVEEMGCCDAWAPVIFYFLFGGAVLGVSVFGTTKIGGFANALIGMVCQAERLGADAKGFIDSIADPVQNVATLATTQINKVEGVMNSTSNIEGALNEVVAQFGEFVAGVSAIRFNNTVPAFVATVSAEGSSALTSIRSITDPAISGLATTRNSVNSQLIGVKAMLTGISTMANTTTFQAKEAIDSNLNPMIAQVTTLISPYRQYISDAGIAVFALSLVVIPLTLVGFLFLKFGAQTKCTGISCIDDIDDLIGSWIIRLAWFLTFIACILMFLFSGIFTPLSWIMNDSCKMIYAVPTQEGYNDYIKPQLTSFMPSTSSAAPSPSPSPPPAGGLGMPTISVENITLGCFNNVTLMTSMGMDKMFDFRKLLNFSAADNTAIPTSFPELAQLSAQVKAVNVSTFGWDESAKTTELAQLTAACTAVPGSASCTAKDELKNANKTIRGIVTALHANMSKVDAKVANMTATLTDFKNKMAQIKTDAEPLMVAADNLKNAGDCGFLKTNYVAFADLLCKDVKGNILTLSLCMWIVGFLGIPMIICNVYMNVNIGGVGYVGEVDADGNPVPKLDEDGKPKTFQDSL